MFDTTNTGIPVDAISSDESSPCGNHIVKNASTDASIATGWKARLDLSFEPTEPKTILRRSHRGPLMLQRPFYPEGSVCHAYVLHPPGGIVGGDQLLINAACRAGASGLVTTPGATKYYGSDGRIAGQHQHLSVAEAALEWMPQENIFFDGCRAAQILRVDLTSQSRFIGWDINCFGRPAGNHGFTSGDVSSRLEIFLGGQALLMERLHVRGAAELSRLSGLRGCVVSGTMIAIAPNITAPELLDGVRDKLPDGGVFAATKIDNMIIVRYLGHSSESARQGFVAAWRVLRPIIMQRDVMVPRIWAT